MFGLWQSKKPEVLKYEHWTFEQFECSPSEFYDAIEEELKTREVPGMLIERIDHKEGGVLSAKRVYLRMRRERLVFDVCLAPFGTHWFCSRRYSLINYSLTLFQLLIVLLILAGVEWLYVSLFGLILGSSLFGASAITLALLMRNSVPLGLYDLDAALLQIPVIGAIYVTLLRKETYYREDTRAAYVSIVDAILKLKIDELVDQKGAKLVAYSDATPPSRPSILRMIADLLRLGR